MSTDESFSAAAIGELLQQEATSTPTGMTWRDFIKAKD